MFLREIVMYEARFADKARLIDEIDELPGMAAYATEDVIATIDEACAA